MLVYLSLSFSGTQNGSGCSSRLCPEAGIINGHSLLTRTFVTPPTAHLHMIVIMLEDAWARRFDPEPAPVDLPRRPYAAKTEALHFHRRGPSNGQFHFSRHGFEK